MTLVIHLKMLPKFKKSYFLIFLLFFYLFTTLVISNQAKESAYDRQQSDQRRLQQQKDDAKAVRDQAREDKRDERRALQDTIAAMLAEEKKMIQAENERIRLERLEDKRIFELAQEKAAEERRLLEDELKKLQNEEQKMDDNEAARIAKDKKVASKKEQKISDSIWSFDQEFALRPVCHDYIYNQMIDLDLECPLERTKFFDIYPNFKSRPCGMNIEKYLVTLHQEITKTTSIRNMSTYGSRLDYELTSKTLDTDDKTFDMSLDSKRRLFLDSLAIRNLDLDNKIIADLMTFKIRKTNAMSYGMDMIKACFEDDTRSSTDAVIDSDYSINVQKNRAIDKKSSVSDDLKKQEEGDDGQKSILELLNWTYYLLQFNFYYSIWQSGLFINYNNLLYHILNPYGVLTSLLLNTVILPTFGGFFLDSIYVLKDFDFVRRYVFQGMKITMAANGGYLPFLCPYTHLADCESVLELSWPFLSSNSSLSSTQLIEFDQLMS